MSDIEEGTLVEPAGVREAVGRSGLFAGIEDDAITFLSRNATSHHFGAGDVVVEAGSEADGLYFVVSGRVAVLRGGDGEDADDIVAELESGQYFGEMALLDNEPRANTIVAALDCSCLFLTKADFNWLLEERPDLAVRLSRVLSRRARSSSHERGTAVRTVACLSASDGGDPWALALGLARTTAKETSRSTLVLDLYSEHAPLTESRVPLAKVLANPSAALRLATSVADRVRVIEVDPVEALETSAIESALPALLERLSQEVGFVTIATGKRLPRELLPWLVRQCDRSMVVARPTARGLAGAKALLDHLESKASATRMTPVALVLAKADDAPNEELTGGAVALAKRPLRYVANLDTPAPNPSLRRTVRRLLGIAVGIAMGGGGARCAAQIGVLDVFERDGIPVDLVGGTSGGALTAGMYARGMSPDEMLAAGSVMADGKFVADYTVPRTAILAGRRVETTYRSMVGNGCIEDLPMDYFAVATDLCAGRQVILDHGPLWEAIRASSSPPGLLPPIRRDGMLLVDGAVVNNVPGDVLKARGANLVIAINVTPQQDLSLDVPDPAAGNMLSRAFGRIAPSMDGPSILTILARSLDVQGLENVKSRIPCFDVHIRPDVTGFTLLSFDAQAELVDRGRTAGQAQLAEVRAAVRELTAKA